MRVAKPVSRVGFADRLRAALTSFMTNNPSRFALLVFVALILLFTFLLSLPISTASGRRAPFVDAFFTAVSTICVTGLTTVDMATYWSPFGHVVIVIGTQLGCAGVLTMASVLGLIVSRRLGLRQKLIAAGDANPLRFKRGPVAESQAVRLSDTQGLLVTVAVSMLVIEGGVFLLLYPRMLLAGHDPVHSLWESLTFATMSFTNTGFVLTSPGLAPFATDTYFLLVLSLSVILGAIGFPVFYSLSRVLFFPRRWSLHVRLTLAGFGALLFGGAIAYIALEWNNANTFGGDTDFGQRLLQSFFLSTMTRSGGFSTIDTAELSQGSLLVTDMLMFVGGGSASTAGGIKVTTLAVLFLAALAEARGRTEMEAFGRRIPQDVLRLAVAVTLWGATVVAVATIAGLALTQDTIDYVLFDVISAFATVGLSTGFTMNAPDAAQFVIALTIFLGRVGTVTFAAALAARQHAQLFTRPEERPIVG